MKIHRVLCGWICGLALCSALLAGARDAAPSGTAPGTSHVEAPASADRMLEGEKRFHANCGRCHQAPHKLSPAMMRTAIRHMRIRATITDEDMRLIMEYMTQ